MIIGITGATGFLARHVAAAARSAGHELIGFSRSPRPLAPFREMRPWLPVSEVNLADIDALIHLAGESLFGVWTKTRKDRIRSTRVNDTCALAARFRDGPHRPASLIAASGAAFYGDRGDEELTEASPRGQGFLSDVCHGWEAATADASPPARTVSLRTGMVLGHDGGAAPILGRIFRLALGGRLGPGNQWMPWIHASDMGRLCLFAAENPALIGPVNAVAPGGVTNAQFTRTMASTLHRPAFLPVPAWALRLLPGGMHEMFLQSQHIIPTAALNAGFRFLHPDLPSALSDVFSR